AMSAALSFQTVFAIVPALVVALLVMKPLGMMAEGKRDLRELLDRVGFDRLVMPTTAPATSPATQPAVFSAADKIEQMVDGVARQLTFRALGPIGAVLLIWSALTLLMTMEESLNRVFGASRRRGLARRVLLYWSALTLGPVLLATTSYLAEEAVKAIAAADLSWLLWLVSAVLWASPPLVGIVLLAALYKLMPNTYVDYRAALAGAVVAVPLWMVAKWAFALYVIRVGSSSLYGALGLVPLFLMWLNLSWLIFLFGAELASTASNLKRMQLAELAERITLGPADLLAAALAVADGYASAEGAVTLEAVATRLNLPDPSARALLDRLGRAGVVVRVEKAGADAYVLASPADTIRVADVMALGHRHADGSAEPSYQDPIGPAVGLVRRLERQALGETTLADVLEKGRAG
ncbi:MAG TPA: YhjD/YihY/BrkB family envelope integrity protein, partial [Phycisphaerae bacterium]|nr:YhjD/YihY/BrkB family envelope integrity protein [Phycisphaerae bacterium]